MAGSPDLDGILVHPVGRVLSPLIDPADAPRQGDEGAPEAWIVLLDEMDEAMADLVVGSDVLVLTWLDRADRRVLSVHPRDDARRPRTGVFSTRSQDRPNPIGLHLVTIAAIEGRRLRVHNLEAVDGTPVLDIKPVLGRVAQR